MRRGRRPNHFQCVADPADRLERMQVTGVVFEHRRIEHQGLFHTALSGGPVPFEKVLEHAICDQRIGERLVTLERRVHILSRPGKMDGWLPEGASKDQMHVSQSGVSLGERGIARDGLIELTDGFQQFRLR